MKIENIFNRLPNKLQMVLILAFFPVLILVSVLGIAGYFILIDFILRG